MMTSSGTESGDVDVDVNTNLAFVCWYDRTSHADYYYDGRDYDGAGAGAGAGDVEILSMLQKMGVFD